MWYVLVVRDRESGYLMMIGRRHAFLRCPLSHQLRGLVRNRLPKLTQPKEIRIDNCIRCRVTELGSKDLVNVKLSGRGIC
jgi:hypothetical protein